MAEPVFVEVDECDACGFGPVLATSVKSEVRASGLHICHVCYRTLSGNAAIYGHDLYPDATVLNTIAHCTNIILAAIKEAPRA